MLESYAQPVNDAEDPANEIEDSYNPKHNAVFRWRSLRLFALSRVSFLAEATFATEALVTASRRLEEEREERRKSK